MNGRVLVVCPTRDNPRASLQMLASVLSTSELADVVFCVDEDQCSLYRSAFSESPIPPLSCPSMSVEPRSNIVTIMNKAVAKHPGYSAIGLSADDAMFTTPGWDKWVLDQLGGFPNTIGVVSAHHNNGSATNFPFVSGTWVDRMGWYLCPDTYHFCCDTVMEMLGEATRIVHATETEFHIEHAMLRNEQAAEKFVLGAVQFLNWCITKRRDTVRILREAMAT